MIILQSETNGLESENNRLTSSLSSSYDGSPLYLRDNSTHSIYTLDQIKVIRSQLCSRYDKHLQQHNHILTINNKLEIQDLNNADVQTLDFQIKQIISQLIPFVRLHINNIFNQSILSHIREHQLFLFKQQRDSAQLIHHFPNQYSQSIEKTIEKYCETSIRDGDADLIRDISDVIFDELIK
ncbi:unnamed protein product [Rotaria sp. Silwood2]|nr:unnamed protein product [Rotaria sp. Silwood2]